MCSLERRVRVERAELEVWRRISHRIQAARCEKSDGVSKDFVVLLEAESTLDMCGVALVRGFDHGDPALSFIGQVDSRRHDDVTGQVRASNREGVSGGDSRTLDRIGGDHDVTAIDQLGLDGPFQSNVSGSDYGAGYKRDSDRDVLFAGDRVDLASQGLSYDDIGLVSQGN